MAVRPREITAPGQAEPSGVSGATSRWRSADLGLSELDPVHPTLDVGPPMLGPRYDMHFGLELGVVLSGRMRRHYRSWDTELEAGQVWLCGVWERHGWEVVAGTCRRLVMVVLPRALHEARLTNLPELDWIAPFRVPPQERPQVRGGKRAEALAIAWRLARNLQGTNAALLSLLATLELLLLLFEGSGLSPEQPPVPEGCYQAAERALEFALSRRGRVTTREAAEACAMSSRAFATGFESAMGISFARFVLRHRLSEAARQLLHTDDPVEAVAARCGFSHPSHFSHCFRRHYRVSPTIYREAGTQESRAR